MKWVIKCDMLLLSGAETKQVYQRSPSCCQEVCNLHRQLHSDLTESHQAVTFSRDWSYALALLDISCGHVASRRMCEATRKYLDTGSRVVTVGKFVIFIVSDIMT